MTPGSPALLSARASAAAARPSGPSTGPQARVADLDRRFHAFAIDRLVAWGADAAATVVVARLLWSRGHPLACVLAVAATVLLVDLVLAVLLGTTGATPGKSLLGLRLVHTGTGTPIGVGPALLRTGVLVLAAVPFGLGLIALARTAVTDPTRLRRGWHDQLASSVVLDVSVPASVPASVAPSDDPRPGQLVNLTALRLAPSRPLPGPPAVRELPAPSRPSARVPVVTWWLAFDTGQRVAVDALVLVGRRPEPRQGEQGARLVTLPTADGSVSQTHAHVVVAGDGALVVTDRGSVHGSTLVRRGMPKPLAGGRPTTLLEGDVVALGDRTMTVHRVA
jgi:uncharacterized RDD family membrane protein YckC